MSLSGEEFSRLQGQILDLRNANYELKEKLDRQATENNSLREILQRQKVELTKNKVQGSLLSTLSKVGGRATGGAANNQEVEHLIQEKEKLQQKLLQQEQEFKLQYNTVKLEIDKLQNENNSLRVQLDDLSCPLSSKLLLETAATDGYGGGGDNGTLHPDAIGNVSCENASSFRKHQHLGVESDQIATEENSECASESSTSIDVEVTSDERRNISDQLRDSVVQASSKIEYSRLKNEVEKLTEKVRKKQESIVLLQEEKEHLYSDNMRLQEEIKQVAADKHKELALQKHTLNASVEEKVKEMDSLKHLSNSRITELEQIISSLNRETTETVNNSSRQTAELESALREASERYDQLCVSHKRLQSDYEQMSSEKQLTEQQVAMVQQENMQLNKECEELKDNINEMKQTVERLTEENIKNVAKIRQLESSLEEATKLAEKRKNMMEDFANQCSKSVEQAKLEAKSLGECEAQLKEELKMCELHNCEMESQMDKLSQENSVLSAFLDQVKQQNSLLQSQLETTQSQLKDTQQSMAEQISALQSKHSSACQNFEKRKKCLEEEIEIKNGAMKKSSSHIADLQQQILDKVEERRIGEQKLVVKLKDLQKVAKQEKQKADKLQQKLEEFLCNAPKLDSQIKTGYDDVYLSVSRTKNCNSGMGGAAGGDIDSLSVSSYGQLSDLPPFCSNSPNTPQQQVMSPNGSVLSSSQGNTNNGVGGLSSTSACGADDIKQLFEKLAILQQDKWMLEEKLSHLEANCASMSDDLIEKSRIIENYLIEKGNIDKTASSSYGGCNSESNSFSGNFHGSSSFRPGSPSSSSADNQQRGGGGQSVALLSLKNRMRDFINKDNSELSSRDVNKRLQNMLEETLTKNIQLQKDVDWLSSELAKYQPMTSS